MKYYIIAGEASGDLHGSNLIKQLKKKDTNAKFRVWGGDLMKATGAHLVKHYKNHSVMGFFQVLLRIFSFKKIINFCKNDVVEYNPDALILIDYSAFNLRIAKHAKENGLKIYYYIAPQVWAWRQKRVLKIKQYVDRVLTTLPFEKEFYKKWDYEVDYVGHPLLDAYRDFSPKELSLVEFQKKYNFPNTPLVALLPGSRMQEVKKMMPVMAKIPQYFPTCHFVIAASRDIPFSVYDKYILTNNVSVLYDRTYEILHFSRSAIVTSGTATLEAALFLVPQVVVYKTGWLTSLIVKNMLYVKYISLVNLILNRPVIKELVQTELNVYNLRNELSKLTEDEEYRIEMLRSYDDLYNQLGGEGASERAAVRIIELMKQ